ncbi:tetratricopeptide repeat protein [Hyalangium rubrum]|uniref:Tetratricopeptide repeat protein n=1 Tax=Hyalangium rubrum TaxID=3103134 RepID=A0ABU5HH96_9BACT|nr:tetratricopeptide repeat protein [Hyalangium sp. s54d21]MDY7232832.1 tetratricopeptide repeat protein [Hyalangium sp. s54d21]
MDHLFTWVHLSDLHVGHGDAGTRWDQKLVVQGLLEDLRGLSGLGVPPPDAIMVTGDIAFSGNVLVHDHETESREYALAGQWLSSASTAVGLDTTRVFLVPGNHDVQRTADRDRSIRRLVKALRVGLEPLDEALADPNDRALLARRLANYLDFSAGFAPACLAPLEPSGKRLFWQYRFRAREVLPIRLVGLNTALLCADDQDQGQLRLGMQMLAQALTHPPKEAGELLLVLSHHPFQGRWLADERESHNWVRNHAQIHLSGHVHDQKSEDTRAGWGPGLVTIAAGAVHGESQPTGVPQGHGYNIASVVADHQGHLHLRVWPRAWSATKKRFHADIDLVPEGRNYAEHSLGFTVPSLRKETKPKSPPQEQDRASSASPSPLFEGPGGVPALEVRHFLGRVDEFAALREALTDDATPCIVVAGPGGIGKTSLVHQFVATEARALFAEAAWLDASALTSELSRVAMRFGWKAEAHLRTVSEANRYLAQTLHEKPVLLIIDNVDPQHVNMNLGEIPVPGGRCRTLITTRAAILHEDLGKPAQALTLGLWDNKTCRTYLRKVAAALNTTPDAELDALAQFVGNLPLALRLLARLLLRPGATPNRVLASLHSKPLYTLDSVAKGDDRGIAATLLASCEGLSQDQWRVLHAMSACAKATCEPVVAAVAALPEQVVANALAELAQRSLIDFSFDAPRRWGMHDLVRLFMINKPEAPEVSATHLSFVRTHLEAHKDPSDWQALESQLPEVLWALDRLLVTDGEGAREVLAAVREHLMRRGKYGEIIDYYTRLLKLLPPESASLAEAQGDLGYCYRRLGDLSKALHFSQYSLTISERLGNIEYQANALGNLGLCYRRLGDLPKAIDHSLRALALEERLGRLDRQANALGNLGLYYRSLEKPAQALEYHQRAWKLDEQLGRLEGQANALTNIGLCYGMLGEIEKALDHHQRSFAIDTGLGRLGGQATSLGNMGLCYKELGDLEKAIAHYQQALELDERLGRYEGQANHLSNRGDCYLQMNRSIDAENNYRLAIKLYKQMGLADNHPSIERVSASLQKALRR